jgi:ribosomal-protein-alanine N-acetyltransferase
MLDVTTHFEKFPVLETERCILREITLEDTPDCFAYMSEDAVTKYLPWDTAETLEDAQTRMQRNIGMFYEKTGYTWGIVNKENNKMMGMCLLFHLNTEHHRAELGYALGSSWWRQGFAFEVTTRVVDFAFTDMDFHSLEAHIDPENVGSAKLLEKLGFVREAYFRENFYDAKTETFGDTAIFSLLKSGWEK